MRIALCDYSGHPFQVELSRELARRGHDVLHLYFAEFQTPRGKLQVGEGDPPTLAIEGVSLGRAFSKYSLLRRRFQEVEVGTLIADRIARFRPEVVIGCNLPLDALDRVARRCAADRVPFVFWQQDIYSRAIGSILAKKLGPLGRLVGRYYHHLERRVLRTSAAIVVIAQDFVDILRRDYGVEPGRVHVVENWAPLDEIPPRSKDNGWSRAQALHDQDVVLYTGTLGMKHDPAQIAELARRLRDRAGTVVVASEGPAADWLAERAAEEALPLRVLPFQPFADYPDVLGTADVVISVLEPEAGSFSVPSKVLSYLSAGRPIVLSAPTSNLASRIVTGERAGLVVAPGDTTGFVGAVLALLDDPAGRQEAAGRARAYAERAFAIRPIGDRFEAVLKDAVRPGG